MLREGRSRRAGGLVVHVRDRDGGGHPRLGLVVPGGVGSAVERNRVKRRVRAVWRELGPRLTSVDCVVVARREAASMPFRELSGGMARCLRELRALAGDRERAEAVR